MRPLLHHRHLPLAASAAIGLIYVLFSPATADLAAQVYRLELWKDVGFSVWNSQWYGGHHLPAYSLTFPPLGALFGPHIVGVVAALIAIALFTPLASKFTSSAKCAALANGLFASGMMTNVLVGRVPFTLGLMFGVAVWACLLRDPRPPGRTAIAAVLAILTLISSPVAGLFLLIALAAWGLANRSNFTTAVVVGIPTVVCGIALSFLFPEGGIQPFSPGWFWPLFLTCLLGTFLIKSKRREILFGSILYLLLLVVLFVAPTPMGSNTIRMGVVLGPALLILGAWNSTQTRSRFMTIMATSAVLSLLAWVPAVEALVSVKGDRSTQPEFYSEVEHFLKHAGDPVDRVEIPFTKNHWEAAYLAPKVPLARGWERQLDLKYNAIFYDGELSSATYRRWIELNGVQWVALPKEARLDFSAKQEKALLLRGLEYLELVYESDDWLIWRVEGVQRSSSKSEVPVRATVNGFDLDAPRPGIFKVRVRYTRYWRITQGNGCIMPTTDGWTRVRVFRRGPVSVAARFSLGESKDRCPTGRPQPATSMQPTNAATPIPAQASAGA